MNDNFMKIQRLAVPMKYVSVSQIENSQYNHKGLLALDMNGMDAQQDYGRAPCRVKVLAILDKETTTMNNTVLFGSCDEQGNQVKVLLNDGTKEVVTIAMTHINTLNKFDLKVGKIYEQLDICYLEGMTGNATGNHIHFEVGKGWQTKKVKRSDGIWALQDLISLKNCFCLLKGYHEVCNLGLDIYKDYWPWVDSLTVEENTLDPTRSPGKYGIDVSAHDANMINYTLAKEQGVEFVIARAGFGADKESQHDECWQKNIDKCNTVGIPMGAYIYSYAENIQEAINEAKHIIRLANEEGGPNQFPYGLWFDQEDKLQTTLSKELNTEMALVFAREVQASGYKAGVYASYDWFKNKLNCQSLVGAGLFIWIAHYGKNTGEFQEVNIEFDYQIRQYTSENSDKLFSTRERLDQNVCYFDFLKEEVNAYMIEEPSPIQEENENNYESDFKFLGKINYKELFTSEDWQNIFVRFIDLIKELFVILFKKWK